MGGCCGRSGFFALGAGQFIFVEALGLNDNFVQQNHFSRPFDFGIILGHGTISLLGLVTIAVAGLLKKLQERLDKIEKNLAVLIVDSEAYNWMRSRRAKGEARISYFANSAHPRS